MTDYETPRSTLRCAKTERELKEGESYWSILYDRGKEFERLDFCDDAWEGPPEDAYCVWRTAVPVKEEKKRPLVHPEVMLEVFQKLEQETDASKVNFRYILALLLMRKRILKLERSDWEEGREYMVFSCKRTEADEHRVLDPHLTGEQIVAVQREVGAILNTDV